MGSCSPAPLDARPGSFSTARPRTPWFLSRALSLRPPAVSGPAGPASLGDERTPWGGDLNRLRLEGPHRMSDGSEPKGSEPRGFSPLALTLGVVDTRDGRKVLRHRWADTTTEARVARMRPLSQESWVNRARRRRGRAALAATEEGALRLVGSGARSTHGPGDTGRSHPRSGDTPWCSAPGSPGLAGARVVTRSVVLTWVVAHGHTWASCRAPCGPWIALTCQGPSGSCPDPSPGRNSWGAEAQRSRPRAVRAGREDPESRRGARGSRILAVWGVLPRAALARDVRASTYRVRTLPTVCRGPWFGSKLSPEPTVLNARSFRRRIY